MLPPNPPKAVCNRLRLPPFVLPDTVLVSETEAPLPALASSMPPPAPPMAVVVAEAEWPTPVLTAEAEMAPTWAPFVAVWPTG